MIITTIIGLISAGYLGYLIGYELGWDDKSKRKKHKLRR